MRLGELVAYLDGYLRIREVPDWRDARNGLQVENAGEVTRVAAAVDACQAVVEEAARTAADLLLVHHGLYWSETRPATGRAYRKLAAIVRGNLAVYSAHLPLDLHPEVGNNVELARLLGVPVEGWFGEHEGTPIGVFGPLESPREALGDRLRAVLGPAPRLLAHGPATTSRVGIITGSAGSMTTHAAAAGCDTFVTGEGQHWTYFEAEELGVNVFFAGHYATETLGVKALAAHLERRFGLPWCFLDHPTGL